MCKDLQENSKPTSMELANRIAAWLRGQVEAAGAQGLVFGMSGGLDSSVVAGLAKLACGDNVLGLIMPCHSSPRSAQDALKVAQHFGIRTHTADLTPAFDALVAAVPHEQGLPTANVAPRLRMAALYCAAQSLGYLVCGTSNKTETLVGYFTKWGDNACDLQPLAGLYKSQVYELAGALGVPQEIIEKPPTADLWEGQTDEGELGITYAELDAVLQAIESGDVGNCNPVSVQRILEMMERSRHKRSPVPVFQP
ncbi:MAG: NAD+ synthase [Armatimonadota bacterium]|nr:NAD+ synthase [Armatimonadota bacterium]